MGKEGVVTVRLTQEEIDRLDVHTRRQLSRSQIVRTLIQDFLEKSAEEQRQFLIRRFFGTL